MDVTFIITAVSVALAAIMSVVAWRAMGAERRRSEARVASLAAEIRDHGPTGSSPVTLAPVPLTNDLFASAESRPTSSRLGTVAVAVVLLVGSVAALTTVFGTSSSAPRAHSSAPSAETVVAHPSSSVATPIELVALGHQRDQDRLSIHGIIRSGAGTPISQHLVAVVLFFNADGAFVATGRSEVNGSALEPGGEATFVVSVPAATDVAKYRVSFRADDLIVPHLDRRERAAS
jgi:hypothetical protein